MEPSLYRNHLAILKDELLIAMGCTEPIAIALAAAKAREVLGTMPEHCVLSCSGNIVKNAKSVVVPNSGGLHGMKIAAILGILSNNPSANLEVLAAITDKQRALAKQLLEEKFCDFKISPKEEPLFISVTVSQGEETASAEISKRHTNFTKIVKNGKVLLDTSTEDIPATATADIPDFLTVKNSIAFAQQADLSDLHGIFDKQIEYNLKIAEAGLTGDWGANVGKTLLKRQVPLTVNVEARAYAAAGSDARMAGCSLPVVINSGSGNQGITVSLPVIIYAKQFGATRETLLRALALSNLIAIHQKRFIGNLSAFCGVTCAATGAACGVAYLLLSRQDADNASPDLYDVVSRTITNSLGTISGMVCDGAKSSCASKIACALECSLTALEMSLDGLAFPSGEGLTKDNVEDTIAAVGQMAAKGMKATDAEILKIMTREM